MQKLPPLIVGGGFVANFEYDIISYRANLSDSYFTNRQDRYVLLEDCREVADFFAELVEAVGDVSMQLQPDNSVQMMEGRVHPYKGKCEGSPYALSYTIQNDAVVHWRG